MIDEKKLKADIEREELEDHDLMDMLFHEIVSSGMEALGDDEDEIIDFIENADSDMKIHLSQFAEELYEKFPSDRMSDAIDLLANA